MDYDTNIPELIVNIKTYLEIMYSVYKDLHGNKPPL